MLPLTPNALHPHNMNFPLALPTRIKWVMEFQQLVHQRSELRVPQSPTHLRPRTSLSLH